MKKLIIALLLLYYTISSLQAQTPQYEIKEVRVKENQGTNLHHIDFIEKQSGKTLKKFNIANNNPYQNYPFPVSSKTGEGLNNFDLRAQNIERVKKILLPNEIINIQGEYVFSFAGTMLTYHIQNNFAILCYTFVISANEIEYNWYKSTIYVLNSKGEQVYTEKVDEPIFSPLITSDGKYISYCYGWGNENGITYPYGYKIFDITCRGLIIDEKRNNSDGSYMYFDKMFFPFSAKNKGQLYKVYDLHNGILYTKYVPYQDFQPYKGKITEDGIYFGIGQDKYKTYLFKQDFKQQKF